ASAPASCRRARRADFRAYNSGIATVENDCAINAIARAIKRPRAEIRDIARRLGWHPGEMLPMWATAAVCALAGLEVDIYCLSIVEPTTLANYRRRFRSPAIIFTVDHCTYIAGGEVHDDRRVGGNAKVLAVIPIRNLPCAS